MSDQVKAGEISLIEVTPEEAKAAKARLDNYNNKPGGPPRQKNEFPQKLPSEILLTFSIGRMYIDYGGKNDDEAHRTGTAGDCPRYRSG